MKTGEAKTKTQTKFEKKQNDFFFHIYLSFAYVEKMIGLIGTITMLFS